MRVVLIHQAFASPTDPGGTRHYEFARHCVQEGHEFTIVASSVNYSTGVRSNAPREEYIDGIRVLRAYTPPTVHRSYAWRLYAFVVFMISSLWTALRAGPVDVVMGTSPPIFQGLSAWLLATLRRRPLLFEVRDLFALGIIEDGIITQPLLVAVMRWVERFAWRHAKHIIINSPAFRDYLIEQAKIPATKITIIPNGVDPDMFAPDERGEEVRRQFGLEGKFVVVYAGALGISNSIPTLLQAAVLLRDRPQVHFLIVGDGKEREALEAQAQELQLASVAFVGARPKSEMRQFLAAADACVATLTDTRFHRMTYPNKVFDYMAAGRPTILGIEGVIREVVEAAHCGICTPQADAPAIAEAVRYLMDNPAQAEAMGRVGHQYVESHFNRDQHAQQFVQLLQQLSPSASEDSHAAN